MINKTVILIFLFVLLNNCGKKADPEYKAINGDIQKQTII